jgi:hypothetical protein
MKTATVSLFFIFLIANGIIACEITFDIAEKTKNKIFKTGDTVSIEVKIQLTHRICSVDIKKTKFSYKNLKIIGATDWKEVRAGLFSRQIKAQITDDKAKAANLSVSRQCDKEGGYSVLIFNNN